MQNLSNLKQLQNNTSFAASYLASVSVLSGDFAPVYALNLAEIYLPFGNSIWSNLEPS